MAGPLHEKALRLYDQYLIIGGMPAVVAAYRTPGSIEPQVLQNMILSAYISDMAKYCSNSQSVKNMETFESIPMQLAKNNQKFMLKHIKSGARASTHGDSIEWLAMSGLALKCYRCTRPVLPLDINREAGCFKLYMSDAGLLSAKLHMDLQKLASRDSISSNYLGAMTENYVAAQLIASNHSLYYWESDYTAEVDFLLEGNAGVIPLEVKSGENVRARSLSVFMGKYQPAYAVRISRKNFGYENSIKSVPLYERSCYKLQGFDGPAFTPGWKKKRITCSSANGRRRLRKIWIRRSGGIRIFYTPGTEKREKTNNKNLQKTLVSCGGV